MNARYLKKFCSHSRSRKEIAKPWSVGEFTVATDGKIIIRVKRLKSIPENPNAPSIDRIFNLSMNKIGGWIFVQRLTPMDNKVPVAVAELGGAKFNYRYLVMLSRLKNCRIAPQGDLKVPFMFDGGDGFLMSMRVI